MIENDDKPGVIGLLGNALGKKKININRLYLSNQLDDNTGFALAFISVDSPVDEETLEFIANMDEVKSIEQVIFKMINNISLPLGIKDYSLDTIKKLDYVKEIFFMEVETNGYEKVITLYSKILTYFRRIKR